MVELVWIDCGCCRIGDDENMNKQKNSIRIECGICGRRIEGDGLQVVLCVCEQCRGRKIREMAGEVKKK